MIELPSEIGNGRVADNIRFFEPGFVPSADKDADRRRRVFLKRKVLELRGDQTLFIRLIRTLQENNEDQMAQLLRLFRRTSSIDDIKDFIGDGLLGETETAPEPIDLGSPTLRTMQIKCITVQRRLGLLHNDPTYRVHSICRWTSVVDDATASHLFSLYFAWEHQVWRPLDPGLLFRI